MVLVPNPPPTAPAAPRSRKIWLIAGLLSLAVLAADRRRLVARHRRSTRQLHHRAGHARRRHARGDRHRHGQPSADDHRWIVCLRRHPAALLRLQHASENGPDLRQDRSAPVSDRRRSEQSKSRDRESATRKGQGQPSPTRSSDFDHVPPSWSKPTQFPRIRSTMPRMPTIRRRRRSHSTRRPSSSARPRSMPPKSISTTPISCRRWTAPWCRAT